jgi:glycosyltransferase involved in cell wall biosynthesis
MKALAIVNDKVPKWKYVCKVWPQPRTESQNAEDLALAQQLGIADKVIYATNTISRDFMPYLIGACDIYAAPSRLEGFGMPQVEAGSCEIPVVGIAAMGMLDTLVEGKTAFMVRVAQRIVVNEVTLGKESGYEDNHKIIFTEPRTVDYRANIEDIANALETLMNDADLRQAMGKNARIHVVEHFDYRKVAHQFIEIIEACNLDKVQNFVKV